MTFYPIKPTPAPRLTQRDRWKKRDVVIRYFAFRDEVEARGVKIPIPSQVIFWMPMPASWSASKQQKMVGTPHTVRPDLDNLLKALLDSAFREEDATVWSIWPQKMWSIRPGIEVLHLCREIEAGGIAWSRRDASLTTTDERTIHDG